MTEGVPTNEESKSPHKRWTEASPEREAAMRSEIIPLAEAISEKEIWDVDVNDLKTLQEHFSDHNMGQHKLSRGEFPRVVDELSFALQDRKSMLDGTAHRQFTAFKSLVDAHKVHLSGGF